MNMLSEYSYIWETDKDKYVLLNDELGSSIIFINDKDIMFLLIDEDALVDSVIAKMMENGNKVYNNITELQEAIGIR